MSKPIDLDLTRKWMFYHCPKEQSWIVQSNLPDILEGTQYHNLDNEEPLLLADSSPPPLKAEEIIYVHSTQMSEYRLTTLIEATNGWYLIDNVREVITPDPEPEPATPPPPKEKAWHKGELIEIESVTAKTAPKPPEIKVHSHTYYTSSNLKAFSHDLIARLDIIKFKNMKLNQPQQARKVYPHQYGSPNVNRVKLLHHEITHQPPAPNSKTNISPDADTPYFHLDLTHNTAITGEDLKQLATGSGSLPFGPTSLSTDTSLSPPLPKITHLTLSHTSSIRDFEWCGLGPFLHLHEIDLINLPHFINRSVAKILDSLPNLKQFRIHLCPQITFPVLKILLSKDQLEEIAINDPNMVCQPNAYSGLISEEEWQKMGNRSVKKLLINSNNLSLDIIDYLKTTCHTLQALIIQPHLFKQMIDSLVDPGNYKHPDPKNLLHIVGTDGNSKVTFGRDFILKNLLKQKCQKPFSDSMMSIINLVNGDGDDDDSSDDSDSDSDNK